MSNSLEDVPGALPKRGHVLLVEDDEPSAIYATAALRHFGCEVSLARDGDEAVNAAMDRHFDVILMDYHLPIRSGVEATTLIRMAEAQAIGQATPIVGLTASSCGPERDECLKAGMDDVLFKPFFLADMLQMLDRWVPVQHAGSRTFSDPPKLTGLSL
jgi:CheY-like chemotaxis protein